MAWAERYKGGHRARWKAADGKVKAGPSFPTDVEALRWAAEHGHHKAESPLLMDVLKDWKLGRIAERNVTQPYLDHVEETLGRLFVERKWLRVSDLTYQALYQWRTDCAGVNVRNRMAYLLSVLRWARRPLGLTIDPEVLLYRRPREKGKAPRVGLLQHDQVVLLLERAATFGTHAHGILHYISTYGARPSTACKLLIRQIDFSRGTLGLDAKHSGGWEHPLLTRTLNIFAILAKGRKQDEHLFLKPFERRGQTTLVGPEHTKHPWELDRKGGAGQLGKWYTDHVSKDLVPEHLQQILHLKRYAITGALRAGIDPVRIARWTGHKTVSQILIYGRADDIGTKAALGQMDAARIVAQELAALPAPTQRADGD